MNQSKLAFSKELGEIINKPVRRPLVTWRHALILTARLRFSSDHNT